MTPEPITLPHRVTFDLYRRAPAAPGTPGSGSTLFPATPLSPAVSEHKEPAPAPAPAPADPARAEKHMKSIQRDLLLAHQQLSRQTAELTELKEKAAAGAKGFSPVKLMETTTAVSVSELRIEKLEQDLKQATSAYQIQRIASECDRASTQLPLLEARIRTALSDLRVALESLTEATALRDSFVSMLQLSEDSPRVERRGGGGYFVDGKPLVPSIKSRVAAAVAKEVAPAFRELGQGSAANALQPTISSTNAF